MDLSTELLEVIGEVQNVPFAQGYVEMGLVFFWLLCVRVLDVVKRGVPDIYGVYSLREWDELWMKFSHF